MKVTAFIRKTASKNNTDTLATIYFRVRDGKKEREEGYKGRKRTDHQP